MSRLVKERSDFVVSLPIKGQVNSLNASVAAGVLCYEVAGSAAACRRLSPKEGRCERWRNIVILHWRIFWPSSAGSGRASRNLPRPARGGAAGGGAPGGSRPGIPGAGIPGGPRPGAGQPGAGQPGTGSPAQEAAEDLNAYAAGAAYEEAPAPEEESGAKKKKKKKKGGLFGRKKKVPDFDESEDLYYGIQLKPIDEYSKGYDGATGEFTLPEDSFKSLFDDSKKAIDDEVEQNFQKLQKERRRRVAEAVHNAGGRGADRRRVRRGGPHAGDRLCRGPLRQAARHRGGGGQGPGGAAGDPEGHAGDLYGPDHGDQAQRDERHGGAAAG